MRDDEIALATIRAWCPAICSDLPGNTTHALAELMQRTSYPINKVASLWPESRQPSTWAGSTKAFRQAVEDMNERATEDFIKWTTTGAYNKPNREWPLPADRFTPLKEDGTPYGAWALLPEPSKAAAALEAARPVVMPEPEPWPTERLSRIATTPKPYGPEPVKVEPELPSDVPTDTEKMAGVIGSW